MRINIFHAKELLFLLISVSLFAALFFLSESSRTQLDAIQKTGVLRVVTRNTPTTYYLDNNGRPTGFEYELAKAFSDYLGVELEILIPDTFGEIFDRVKDRSAHIAAAGLSITEERKQDFRFSPAYAYSTPTLIYRVTRGKPAPKTIADLEDKKIHVIANSSHAELMRTLKQTHPFLKWQESPTNSVTELLEDVYNKELDYTVSDDLVFDAQKSYFPGLKKSLVLSKPEPVAWLLIKQNDQSLQRALRRFFERPETQELLVKLKKKYLTRQNQLGFVDIETFRRDMENRFCKLEQYFMMAEQETDIDWRLLASIAYQESHWNPKAVSPTGVRGIMMLTQATAKEMNVADRTDPVQSVMGGAHYLKKVMGKIPERITGDDRLWFALASYNVGYGHLEDARILTSRAGKNPDLWEDVKEFLPLLTQRKYYTTVKRGYARGYEPVLYVKNIRNYFDLLDWELQQAQIEASKAAITPAENEGEILMPGNSDESGEAVKTMIESVPSTL
ncbi:membrane-bound lytic murein transglycosylase MltF [Amphritea balenae]|uniref:Membrane-bound lytic murein transglycosylase F n=1 Tax=Amphritea balenae TaxID=452629 RepID=A0A3P1SJU4_9GAMM|nr:membrane-bound lytic murein transglycosylase MltF [Amphritea balenae]RRC97561.1 membrane-bound lytic murein transglycosylase MltF [Amphritea balenae]GGK74132.1 membrane-bound lytic murein transglycosylase F [Amphritea balenae]